MSIEHVFRSFHSKFDVDRSIRNSISIVPFEIRSCRAQRPKSFFSRNTSPGPPISRIFCNSAEGRGQRAWQHVFFAHLVAWADSASGRRLDGEIMLYWMLMRTGAGGDSCSWQPAEYFAEHRLCVLSIMLSQQRYVCACRTLPPVARRVRSVHY